MLPDEVLAELPSPSPPPSTDPPAAQAVAPPPAAFADGPAGPSGSLDVSEPAGPPRSTAKGRAALALEAAAACARARAERDGRARVARGGRD